MNTNFDFLGELPEPAPVQENIVHPVETLDRRGTGLELGELGIIPDIDGENKPTRETPFRPMTPTEATFDPRFAFEIALGMEAIETICDRYDISEDHWYMLSMQPSFKMAVVEYQTEIDEKGITFRLKARIQAEAYLKDAHLLIKHPLTSASVKADLIKWITKVADLEPHKSDVDQGTTFNLQINM